MEVCPNNGTKKYSCIMCVFFNPVSFFVIVCNIAIEKKANYLQLIFCVWEADQVQGVFLCLPFLLVLSYAHEDPQPTCRLLERNDCYTNWEDEGNKSRALVSSVEEWHTLQSTGWKGRVQKEWQSGKGQKDALSPDRCDAQRRDLCLI